MGGEQSIPMTPELGRSMLARKLIVKNAPRGCSQWLHWQLHSDYLDIPRAERPENFWDWVNEQFAKDEP